MSESHCEVNYTTYSCEGYRQQKAGSVVVTGTKTISILFNVFSK